MKQRTQTKNWQKTGKGISRGKKTCGTETHINMLNLVGKFRVIKAPISQPPDCAILRILTNIGKNVKEWEPSQVQSDKII